MRGDGASGPPVGWRQRRRWWRRLHWRLPEGMLKGNKTTMRSFVKLYALPGAVRIPRLGAEKREFNKLSRRAVLRPALGSTPFFPVAGSSSRFGTSTRRSPEAGSLSSSCGRQQLAAASADRPDHVAGRGCSQPVRAGLGGAAGSRIGLGPAAGPGRWGLPERDRAIVFEASAPLFVGSWTSGQMKSGARLSRVDSRN